MTPPPRIINGFTLIELTCSMAIGVFILFAATLLLGRSGDDCKRIRGGLAAEREARELFSRLASDLATARFHKNTILEKSSTSWPADRLGFLCLQPAQVQSDAGRIGDLCAVNYFLRDLSIGGKTVRCMLRGFRESGVTFQALHDDKVSPLFSEQPGTDEPIAFGVVSFEARPMSRDASGKWIDWVKNDITGPEALDVCLVVARPSLAGKLKLTEDWNGGGTSGKLLGKPSEADLNKDLEVGRTLIYFPNNEIP